MVQPDGQPKLMDFGVAHLASSVMTTAGQVLGSPSYMSPEQIAGATVTGRSDVYSLAVVAYEMLTGQPPFQGKSITQVIYRVMHEQPAAAAAVERGAAGALRRRLRAGARQGPRAALRDRHASSSARSTCASSSSCSSRCRSPPPRRPRADGQPTRRQLPGRAWRRPRTARPRPRPLGAAGRPPRRDPRGSPWAVALAAIGWAALRRGPEAPVAAAAPTPSAVVEPRAGRSRAARPPRSRSRSARPRTVTHRGGRRPAARAEADARASPTPVPVVEGELVALDRRRHAARAHARRAGPLPRARTADAPRRHRRGRHDRGRDRRPHRAAGRRVRGPVLDAAVLDSVRCWRFEPAPKAGVKVKVRWTARQTYTTGR